jgi:hypothetical protein
MNKPFCRKSYEENNENGIKTSMSLLNQFGYETVDTSEAYSDRDYIVSKKGISYKIEAEMSHSWTTLDDIPGNWWYVSVPYRKRHSGADLFILVNHSMTAVAVARMSEVKKSEVKEKFVYSTNMTEAFFNVPLSAFNVYSLVNGIWKKKKKL